MYSLTDLYNDLISLIPASDIKLGTTYLGVEGSYVAIIPRGSALNLNGVEYVVVGNGFGSFDDGFTPFSLSAWVKLDNPPVDSYNIVMAKQWNTFCAAPGYSFGVSNGKLVAWFWNHACDHFTMSVESTNAVVNNAEWVYVTMTYSGSGVASGIKLYANGVELTTELPQDSAFDNLSGRSIQSEAPFSIGALGDGQWQPIFKGTIDQPLVFGRVLSESDILDLYNDGLGVYGDISNPIFSGLLAGWNLDEGSGYLIGDFSGNGNTGLGASSADYYTEGIVPLP
jgi:hypothetical protein